LGETQRDLHLFSVLKNHQSSHHYQFSLADLTRTVGPALLIVVCFAAVMRFGAALGWLPAPQPALDLDRTVLTHQAKASQRAGPADVVLLGDSSCLMNVHTAELERSCDGSHRFLNLGTFMYVGWNGYAAMLTRYVEANPGRLRAVVILVHPEMLRLAEPSSRHLLFLSDFYSGADPVDRSSGLGRFHALLGLNAFESRFLGRLPHPLPGAYGRYYGFTSDLNAFMERRLGSAVDPNQFTTTAGQGNAEYRLSAAVEPGGLALRAALPASTRMILGLAPLPASFASEDYASTYQRLLAEWGRRTGADAVISDLPPTLPDGCFASTTHLNEIGALRYTRILARALNSRLPAP
jgi:hypothetical protein